jgi:transposase
VEEVFGCKLKIVEKQEGQIGFQILPKNWVVERTFGWLIRQRRLARDYERLPETSESFIYIAMIRLMVRRVANS